MRNSYDQLICVFFRMFSLLVAKDTEKLFSFSIKKLALVNELNRNTMLINNTKTGLLVRIYTVVVLLLVALLAMIVLLLSAAYAQEQPGLRERADRVFRRYEYANAVPLYRELADRRSPRVEDLERLADSYVQMKDYESAENWYARVVAMEGSTAENLIRYGEVLKANGKYDAAKQQLEAYASQTGDRARVALQTAGCDSALVWMADPTVHKLRNEDAVNTSLSEFSVFPVGDMVYYTGEPDGYMRGVGTYGWTGNSFLWVYTADRLADNSLSNAVIAVDGINSTPFHIGPVAAGADGSTLYVTRTYGGKDGEISREDRRRYRTGKLELYV